MSDTVTTKGKQRQFFEEKRKIFPFTILHAYSAGVLREWFEEIKITECI